MSSVHGSGDVRRSASTLSSLFVGGGASRSSDGVTEDDSLRYVAPKEPKQQGHASSQQTSKETSSPAPSAVAQQATVQQAAVQAAPVSNSIVSSGTLRLYVFNNANNAYEAHLGGMPLGFVILGGAKEMLFIYDANKAPQCSLLLNSSCELKVQPNNYVSLSNHAQGVSISLLLESEAAVEAFCRCIVAAKGYNMQRDAAYTPGGPLRHEVTIEGRDEAALGHGDVAGVRYALYELAVDTPIATSIREPRETNAGGDVVKIKVGTGESSPVGGLSAALLGARKGGRYLILVPPSIAGRPNAQCWVLAEVEVVKVKKASSTGSAATLPRPVNLPQPYPAVAEPSSMSRDVSYDVETEAPETVRPPQQQPHQPQAGHSKNDLVHRMAALSVAGRVGGLPIPNILPHRQTTADHSEDTPDELSLHPPAPPPAGPQTQHQPTPTQTAPLPQMSLPVPTYQQPSLRITNMRSQSQTPSVTSQQEAPWVDNAGLSQAEHAREAYSHVQPSMTNSIASGAPPSPSSSLVHATESGISASATTALSALVLQSQQQTQQGIFHLQTLLNDLNTKVDRNLSGRHEPTTFTKMGGRYSTEEWLGSFRMLLEEHERLENSSKEGPDKIAKLHDKIQQLQERIGDLQDKNAQLMMEKTEMLEAAMRRNADFAMKEKELHDEIQELKSQGKAAEEEERVSELLAQLAVARDDDEREAAERTRLEGELNASLALVDELQGQLSAAEAINADLSEELEQLRTAMSEEEQSTNMHDELLARLAAETDRAEALKAEAAAQRSRAEEEENRAAALQEEVDSLRAHVQALETEVPTSSSSNEGATQTHAAPAPVPAAEPPGPTPEMVKSFLGAVFVRTQEVFLAEDLRESSFGAEEVVKRIRAILRGCAQDLIQPGGSEE